MTTKAEGGRVGVGSAAPDVALVDQSGKTVRLSDYRGKIVVVYFYPKNNTPACTAEACAFRDAFEDLSVAGAVVIGVSGDSAGSHKGFAERHGLPFVLLSDEDGAMRRAFGVPRTLGLFPGRVTYVIDAGGVVRHVFSSQLRASKHVSEARAAVARLGGS